jgi:signal transduction histidine kinase
MLGGRAPFPVVLAGVPAERLPASLELAVYFLVAEALTTAAKSAVATRASVTMSTASGLVRVEVADDGRGGADAALGTGLRGLADRVEALGGSLEVESRPGCGTTLRAQLPLGVACDAAAPV